MRYKILLSKYAFDQTKIELNIASITRVTRANGTPVMITPKARKEISRKSPVYRTAQFWNKLPNEIRREISKFKYNKLITTLLSNTTDYI